MPPRDFIKPRDKREELKTYREMGLRRDLKSKIQRRRVEANGLRRVLGDGSESQPYLIVETNRYRKVRLEIERQLLVQANQTGIIFPSIFFEASLSRASRRSPMRSSRKKAGTRLCVMSRWRRWAAR